MSSPHLDFASELLPELVAFRRHLHQNPELSFQEYETTAFLADLMTRWNVPFRRITDTGLVAELKGNADGPVIALRADIDALPITEESDVPFASENDGVMHACGHDGHTAILLGVVRRFLSFDGQFKGTIRFLFQPAEEMPPGGAQALIAAGALKGVDKVYGLHLMAGTKLGTAEIAPGPSSANSDLFTLRIFGKGGHGAHPESTVDAVLVAAHTVVNLQTIVSRRVSPLRSAVVTVGASHAGTTFNVIADQAELKGTVRSHDADVRDLLEREIQRTAAETAAAFGATMELNYTRGYPALFNHPRETEMIKAAAARVLGEDHVHEIQPTMGGEDFSYYVQECPGAFINIGAKDPENDQAAYPHHHPKFKIHEGALAHGVAVLTEVALSELNA